MTQVGQQRQQARPGHGRQHSPFAGCRPARRDADARRLRPAERRERRHRPERTAKRHAGLRQRLSGRRGGRRAAVRRWSGGRCCRPAARRRTRRWRSGSRSRSRCPRAPAWAAAAPAWPTTRRAKGRTRACRRRCCSPRRRRRIPRPATGRPRCRCWRAASICCMRATAPAASNSLLGPAEQMARVGVTVSRALAHDLSSRGRRRWRPIRARAPCSSPTARR